MVGLVAINIGDEICALKQINLLILQVSQVVLARGQQGSDSFDNLSGFRHVFFHEYFADFDLVFGISNESGTFNDRESYDFDPKLN